MSVYKFKMQSILDIKAKLEEQSRQDFAVAAGRLIDEQNALDELKARRQEYVEIGIALRNTTIDVLKIKENKDAIDRMDELIEKQALNVKVAEKELEVARFKMMQARTQTKTYEKLKENDFEEFMHEEGIKESKEIDQLNSYRSAQKADKK